MPTHEETNSLFERGLAAYRDATLLLSDSDPTHALNHFGQARSFFGNSRAALVREKLNPALRWTDLTGNDKYIAVEYYLGLAYLQDLGEANLWEKVRSLYQSIRYFIDYLWTLDMLQVPGIYEHLQFLNLVTPQGRYSVFTLRPIRGAPDADHPDSWPQKSSVTALKAQLENTVDLDSRDLEFFQYTASNAIMQIRDIIKDKIPACLELARIDAASVITEQPEGVTTPDKCNDIWETLRSHDLLS